MLATVNFFFSKKKIKQPFYLRSMKLRNVCKGFCAPFAVLYNPFTNRPSFLRVCSTRLLKTRWEKEKLLITSDFSFSPRHFLPFFENFSAFSPNLKLSSVKSFDFGESKNCHLGKGLQICLLWSSWPEANTASVIDACALILVCTMLSV